MFNDVLHIPSNETQHMSVSEALSYAAKKIAKNRHEAAEVICLNPHGTYNTDPKTVKKTIVNLGVYKGMRPENERIHSAVPGVPKVFILK